MRMEQEWYDKMHKAAVESKHSDGWYPVGLLEWSDDVKDYSEAGTCGDDWLWVKQEDRDQWSQEEDPTDRKIVGKSKLYWWSIGGNPLYGNTSYSPKPWTVIEILQYLVCSPVVAIGRATERGTPVMGIPKSVRIQGMTEWITRQESIDQI